MYGGTIYSIIYCPVRLSVPHFFGVAGGRARCWRFNFKLLESMTDVGLLVFVLLESMTDVGLLVFAPIHCACIACLLENNQPLSSSSFLLTTTV
jgi:hypothetical protein